MRPRGPVAAPRSGGRRGRRGGEKRGEAGIIVVEWGAVNGEGGGQEGGIDVITGRRREIMRCGARGLLRKGEISAENRYCGDGTNTYAGRRTGREGWYRTRSRARGNTDRLLTQCIGSRARRARNLQYRLLHVFLIIL